LELGPSERDAWVFDAQRWICRIKGVLQCKIDLDGAGEISGVHVVSNTEREPRHIVRDVESLLKARLQMNIYYKKIGVVQMMGNTEPSVPAKAATAVEDVPAVGTRAPSSVTFHPPGAVATADPDAEQPWVENQGVAVDLVPAPDEEAAPAPDSTPEPAAVPAREPVAEQDPLPAVLVAEGLTPRITCTGVGILTSDTTVRAEVLLRAGEVEARGKREGANHAESDIQLVARAALDALTELVVEPVMLHLNEIRISDLGGETVVMAAVDLVEGRATDTLFGACSMRHNRQQAVVHAILDALNRRLCLYALKTSQPEA
jgi:hypothetical protein